MPVREIPKEDIERDLEFKTKNDLALLQQKVREIQIEDAERPVLDARVIKSIPESNITRANVYAMYPESKDGLVEQTDAQEQDDATHVLLEVNQLLKLGHWFAAERRLNRELTPEERANRSLSGPLLPINSGTTGFSFSQAPGQLPTAPFFPVGAKMLTDAQAAASSKASQTSGVDTGFQADVGTEMMTKEERVQAQAQNIADMVRAGVITPEQITGYTNDELRAANALLQIVGRSKLKTHDALVNELVWHSKQLAAQSAPPSTTQGDDEKDGKDEKGVPIPAYHVLEGEDTQGGAGLSYGMRKNPRDKYALLGHLAISLQKLNRDEPILSITYARSGAQIAGYPNQHVSPAFRDILKSKLQGREPHLSRLIPLERELYHKLMTLVSKGHMRVPRKHGQPIHAKYGGRIEPVATNIHDPKSRLMILLGSWNAGDKLAKSEKAEAQALAQQLLQSQAISREQYHKIVDTLSS